MQLSRMRVEHVDVLVEEELNELGRLQELPLAAEDAGSLFRRVHDAPARQREDHHEGVLQTGVRTNRRIRGGRGSTRASRVTATPKQLTHKYTHARTHLGCKAISVRMLTCVQLLLILNQYKK